MIVKLYRKIKLRDGRKAYMCTVGGKHGRRAFLKASNAQSHSEAVLARYRRLRGLEHKPDLESAKSGGTTP